MRIAHVRERHAPAGAPWRLAAASARAAGGRPDVAGSTSSRPAGGPSPTDPSLAHDSALYPPAADDARRPARARPARRRACADSSRRFAARATTTTRVLDGGRPRLRAAGPPAAVVPRLLRLRGPRRGRCGSAAAARSRRPGTGCRSSTSATSPRSADPATRSGRRPASVELDYELEVAALSTRPPSTCRPTGREEAIGGYTIFDDWSARDLQREETTVRLGPAKGKDFASSVRAVARDAGRAGRRAVAGPATTSR